MSMTPTTRLEKWLAKIAGESVDIQPKDRLETLLAKIAGESVSITPDDSLEYWLNQIAENGGSGGSSDFSTVEVTVTNNSTLDATAFVPIRADESGMSFAAPSFEIASGSHATLNVILCQGASLCNIDMSSAVAVNITATGSIQVVPDTPICQITGSGTITISDPQ